MRAIGLGLLDAALVATAHYSAFWLRFGGNVPDWEQELFSRMLPYLIGVRGVAFLISLTRPFEPVRASSIIVRIIGATLTSSAVYYTVARWIFGWEDYPRSVIIADTILLSIAVIGVRLLPSLYVTFKTKQSEVLRSAAKLSITGANVHAGVGPTLSYGLGLLAAGVGLTTVWGNLEAVRLPYGRSNPIIYDNDAFHDVYTDEYIMSVASAGDIRLVGMITTSSIKPYNRHVTSDAYEQELNLRNEAVKEGRRIGWRGIPDPVRGVKGHLQKPPSGLIEHTQPIGSAGTELIIQEAKKATSDRPLVVVVGGPLSTVADAYLLDNTIVERVIVAWLGGTPNSMLDYNGWADGWSAYIALQNFTMVIFPTEPLMRKAAARVTKSSLKGLPASSLRQVMIDKRSLDQYVDWCDADSPPAIALMRKDYVLAAKKVSFSHWLRHEGHEVPVFRKNPDGRTYVVTLASRKIATKEWWRALTNPAIEGVKARLEPL